MLHKSGGAQRVTTAHAFYIAALVLSQTQTHDTRYSAQLFRTAVLQRVRCRQVGCALPFYVLQHNCAQHNVAKTQNAFLTPEAYSNYIQ